MAILATQWPTTNPFTLLAILATQWPTANPFTLLANLVGGFRAYKMANTATPWPIAKPLIHGASYQLASALIQ